MYTFQCPSCAVYTPFTLEDKEDVPTCPNCHELMQPIKIEMDEPKHTKRAAGVAVIADGRILTLWRNKWENEGTPFIMPGGGCNHNEASINCAARELFEETEIDLRVHLDALRLLDVHHTKWADEYYIYTINYPFTFEINYDVQKFSGFVWLPLKMAFELYPLMMPALAHTCSLLYNQKRIA